MNQGGLGQTIHGAWSWPPFLSICAPRKANQVSAHDHTTAVSAGSSASINDLPAGARRQSVVTNNTLHFRYGRAAFLCRYPATGLRGQRFVAEYLRKGPGRGVSSPTDNQPGPVPTRLTSRNYQSRLRFSGVN